MEIKLTQGDCIAIPEGCTAEIRDGIITFQQKESDQEFKKGDVIVSKHNEILLVDEHSFDNHILRSFVHIENDGISFFKSPCRFWNEHHPWRLATEEEKQKLFDVMGEKGLYWNAEEKRVEKIRYRARKNNSYWFIDSCFCVQDTIEEEMDIDNEYYESGNYFRTKEDADRFLEIFRESLRKFHQDDQL